MQMLQYYCSLAMKIQSAKTQLKSSWKVHMVSSVTETKLNFFGTCNEKTLFKDSEKLLNLRVELNISVFIMTMSSRIKSRLKLISLRWTGHWILMCTLEKIWVLKWFLRAFGLSHIQNFSVLLATINRSLIITLERQTGGAIKLYLHRIMFDSSSDRKFKIVYTTFSPTFWIQGCHLMS